MYPTSQSYYSKRPQQGYTDSYRVLMDLACNDPTVQECISLIDNVCLCRELDFRIIGKASDTAHPQTGFKRFINQHYVPFLKEAIRSMHVLGFVVWTTVKLESGDLIPEVLPFGTFTWMIEPTTASVLKHKIDFMAGIKPVNHRVKAWVKPNFNVCENSSVLPTVQTPFCHLIEEYIVLRRAIRRYHSADAWNCTARIIVNDEPKEFAHNADRKELFETIDFIKGLQTTFKKQSANPVEDVFMNKRSDHEEVVYPLPTHHHIENTPVLQPVADISFLLNRFHNNVCAVMGIPAEMLPGAMNVSKGSSESRNSTNSAGATLASRLFHVKMMRVARFLSELAGEAYESIYKGEKAEFNIVPMPRMQIDSIADLKTLFDIGALDEGHVLDLSDVLLGSFKRRKKTQSDNSDSAKSDMPKS